MNRFVKACVATIVSTTVFAGAATAGGVEVRPCNHLSEPGVYSPGLSIVVDGERQFIPMGTRGLTRSAIFNERAASEWIRIFLGDADADIDYFDRCFDKSEPKEEEPELVEEEPEEDEPDVEEPAEEEPDEEETDEEEPVEEEPVEEEPVEETDGDYGQTEPSDFGGDDLPPGYDQEIPI